MAGNGFPKIDLHDLKDIWKLGNMALGWARTPLALDGEQLTMYQELCRRYGLEPAEALMEFQKIAFPELLTVKLGESMPTDDRGSGPRPTPHRRPDAIPGEQSGDLGWRDEATGLVSGPLQQDEG